jgi:hypothetical protein
MDPVDERTEFRLRLSPLDDPRRGEVRSSLVDLPGVAEVRFAEGEVVVVADPNVVSDDELLAAVGEAGVEARPA